MDVESIIIIAGIISTVAFYTIFGFIQANLKICQPKEMLIFKGLPRALPDGHTAVDYRIIRGGWAFRNPLFEKVDRLPLNTIPIDLTVTNAYSKDNIPLTVHVIANVKVASNDAAKLANAIERLLGNSLGEIHTIAKETLESNLRDVLASLTPEEVNEDRLLKELLGEDDNDLSALGLQLDTLKIQSVDGGRGDPDVFGQQLNLSAIDLKGKTGQVTLTFDGTDQGKITLVTKGRRLQLVARSFAEADEHFQPGDDRKAP